MSDGERDKRTSLVETRLVLLVYILTTVAMYNREQATKEHKTRKGKSPREEDNTQRKQDKSMDSKGTRERARRACPAVMAYIKATICAKARRRRPSTRQTGQQGEKEEKVVTLPPLLGWGSLHQHKLLSIIN
jgi:hypothetical protein